MPVTFVCLKKDLVEQGAKSFKVISAGVSHRGFIVHRAGKFYAYLNECRHLPIALDFGGASLFDQEHTRLQCHSHGALYEIETGLCVEGPCEGKRLKALEIRDEGESLQIFFPEKPSGPRIENKP